MSNFLLSAEELVPLVFVCAAGIDSRVMNAIPRAAARVAFLSAANARACNRELSEDHEYRAEGVSEEELVALTTIYAMKHAWTCVAVEALEIAGTLNYNAVEAFSPEDVSSMLCVYSLVSNRVVRALRPEA